MHKGNVRGDCKAAKHEPNATITHSSQRSVKLYFFETGGPVVLKMKLTPPETHYPEPPHVLYP